MTYVVILNYARSPYLFGTVLSSSESELCRERFHAVRTKWLGAHRVALGVALAEFHSLR